LKADVASGGPMFLASDIFVSKNLARNGVKSNGGWHRGGTQ
jgi:hypothetical protein